MDDGDVATLSTYRWRLLKNVGSRTEYAVARVGRQAAVLMHRLIAGAQIGQQVDHINHDGLDNRRENLRICSAQQNCFNRRVGKKTRSGIKGVTYDDSRVGKPWRAKATLNGKTVHLGRFSSADEAQSAYNEFAIERHGQFACAE